jgi:hypothetical protein
LVRVPVKGDLLCAGEVRYEVVEVQFMIDPEGPPQVLARETPGIRG